MYQIIVGAFEDRIVYFVRDMAGHIGRVGVVMRSNALFRFKAWFGQDVGVALVQL